MHSVLLALLLISPPFYSAEVTLGSIITAVVMFLSMVMGIIAAWYATKHSLETTSSKVATIGTWIEHHENDAKTRDKLINQLENMDAKLTVLQENTIQRLDRFESWIQNHEKWVDERMVNVMHLQEIAAANQEILKAMDRRLVLLEEANMRSQNGQGQSPARPRRKS